MTPVDSHTRSEHRLRRRQVPRWPGERLVAQSEQVLLVFDDETHVYPPHVLRSPCAAAIGDTATSTIGCKRRRNPLLR